MIERRNLLRALGLGGLFGGAAIKPLQAATSEKQAVFYVNVANIAPWRVDKFIEKVKSGTVIPGWSRIFVPTCEESRVEFFYPKGEDVTKEVKELSVIQLPPKELVFRSDEFWKEFKENIIMYSLNEIGQQIHPLYREEHTQDCSVFYDKTIREFERKFIKKFGHTFLVADPIPEMIIKNSFKANICKYWGEEGLWSPKDNPFSEVPDFDRTKVEREKMNEISKECQLEFEKELAVLLA